MNVIEQLLKLQELDTRLRQVEKRVLKDIPSRKQAMTSSLEVRKNAVASAKEALKARQLELKHAEAEVEAQKDKISKLRMQQYELKSNKEFRAMEEEIRGFEKGVSELEDKALSIMEEVDAAKLKVDENERNLAEEAKQVQQEISELDPVSYTHLTLPTIYSV